MTTTHARFVAGCVAAAVLVVPGRAQAPLPLPTPPVRVSTDLLRPSTVAQPETQSEPHLAVNPADPLNLLAGWHESRFEDGGARTLGYAVSFDGGATWTEGLVPGLTVADGGPWDRASDPWVAFGPNNRAYYASLLFNRRNAENAIGVSVSEDGGRTWREPVVVYRSNPDFNDKEAIVVDTSPASPRVGNVYAAWDINVREGGTTTQHLVVSRSNDGGLSWSAPVEVRGARGNVGAIPRVGPDGTLYVVWAGTARRGGNFRVFFAKSGNGGRTWSRPKKLETIRFNGVRQYRSGNFLPTFDVDPATGALYIAWTDARWTGNDQPTMIVSRDGGATWADAVRVSDGPDDAPTFTTTLAVANGVLGVSFYSLQNDPERDFDVDLYLRISRDGGATFQPATRVTPESFDARFAAQAGGLNFLGDYIGLTAADGAFALCWVGTPLPSVLNPTRRQPDVFVSRVTQ